MHGPYQWEVWGLRFHVPIINLGRQKGDPVSTLATFHYLSAFPGKRKLMYMDGGKEASQRKRLKIGKKGRRRPWKNLQRR
jgi:hypothetical protein